MPRTLALVLAAALALAACNPPQPERGAIGQPVPPDVRMYAFETTTPSPPVTADPHRPHAARASRSRAVSTPRGPVTGDVWWALGNCESHNTNDHWAPFYGYFQFSAGTWRGIGESGLPDEFPYEVQLAAAKRLQARSGWGQWPLCSRKLGLR